jgi:hypothetical protein
MTIIINNTPKKPIFWLSTTLIGLCMTSVAQSAILTQGAAGTFIMSFDRNVLATAIKGAPSNPGHFLVQYYDTEASDYTSRSDSSFYFNNPLREEAPALNLLHDITPAAVSHPSGQAPGRYVKASSPNFSLDSSTLSGNGSLGMTGIELYKGSYNGALIYGDYSLSYDPNTRQQVLDEFGYSHQVSGWYLQNNVSFSAVVYELENLALVYHSATDWKLQGDLMITPENALLLKIPVMTDVGDFCLGFGSFSGCGTTVVPIPASAWLFVSALLGFGATTWRRGWQS